MFEQFMYDRNDKYNLFDKEDLKIRKELNKRIFIQKGLWYFMLIVYVALVYYDNQLIIKYGDFIQNMLKGLSVFMVFVLVVGLIQIIKRSIYLYKIKVEMDSDEKKILYSKFLLKKWYTLIYQSIIIICCYSDVLWKLDRHTFGNILIILLLIEVIRLLIKLGLNKFRLVMINSNLETIIEEWKEKEEDLSKVDIEEVMEDGTAIEVLFGVKYATTIKELKRLLLKLEEATKKEENSIYSKSQLVTNLSHDLKTPLTSIINSIYTLKNDELSEEEKNEQINILKEKSSRLKTLIDNLNEVINCEESKVILNNGDVNITHLLLDAIHSFENKFEALNLDLRFSTCDENLVLNIDKDKMIRVFENLLNNIAKYSLEDTRVYVSIEKEDNIVNLTFKNISKYELEVNKSTLGNRFVKGDKSRNSEGYGLGLSIVKSLIKLHKGKVDISSEGDLFKVSIAIKENSHSYIYDKIF